MSSVSFFAMVSGAGSPMRAASEAQARKIRHALPRKSNAGDSLIWRETGVCGCAF